MSDSVRPHRRQPTRLRCPWDAPGKNTGVDCHFLLQCMKEKSESEVTQSCVTLRDPMDYSLPGSSVHGFSRQEYWSGVPLPSPSSVTSGGQLFAMPWAAACQASLPITNSQSLLKLISIESVMPSDHLILCHPLLLPPSIFPSIRVFSNESILCIRWPKYWSLNFSSSPSNEYSVLISFRIDWLDLLAVK